jgi:hypothetical protein
MQGTWREIRAGWRDIRWLVYLALLLPFFLAPAALLTYLLEGTFSTPASPLAWAISGVAALCAIYWAGILDGPTGRFGRHVWALTVLVVALWLIKRILRAVKLHDPAQQRTEHSARVRLAGHTVVVKMAGELEEKPRFTDISETILRQLSSPTASGADRAVLIGA